MLISNNELTEQIAEAPQAAVCKARSKRESGEPRAVLDIVGGAQQRAVEASPVQNAEEFERDLAESRARLAGIIASAMDAIVTVDNDQRIVMFNQAAEKMFRLTAEEVMGQSLDRIIPPRFHTHHAKDIRKFGSTDVTTRSMVATLPISGLRADGEEFPLEASISQIEVEGQKFYTAIMRDITERKQAEEARGELSRLLDESLNEIYVFDAQTLRFIQVNQGARHNLGYTLDELRALTPLDIKPEFDRQKFEELLRPLRTGEKSKLVFVTKPQRKDDSLYDVEVHLQMAQFEDRSVFVAIILDISERMQAEAALRESEAVKLQLLNRLNEAQQVALIGSWEWDLKTNKVWWSDETYRIFGVTPVSFTPSFEANGRFIHPDDFELYGKSFEDSFKTGEPLNLDVRLVTSDGKLKHCHSLGQIIRDDADQPIRFIGTVMDVTERKQAEGALRESERRYREMLSNVHLISMTLDREGRITFCNNYLLQLTGWSREEVLGDNWFDTFIPPDNAQLKIVFGELLDDQPSAWHHENEILTRSGERRLVRWNNSVLRSTENEVIGVASIGEDITERKRAELNIHNLNRVYAVLSDINQMIVRTREPQKIFEEACHIAVEKGGFLMAWIGRLDKENQRIDPVAWAGVDEGYLQAIDLNLLDDAKAKGPTATATREGRRVISNDLLTDPFMEPWRADALKRGYRSLGAFPLRVDGEVVGNFNLYSGEPDFFDESELALLDELAMDISFALEVDRRETARQQAEAALRSKSEELASMTQQLWQASKLATMGELAASVAHELNNPLTTVTLTLDLIMMQLDGDEQKLAALEKVRTEAERMGKLVRNLLQFSRRSHAQFSTVDLREEIKNTVEFTHYYLRDHRIKVEYDFASDLAPVHADRQQMRQLFLNLLTNSCDAMSEGGTVVARARSAAGENGAANVTVEFADNGSGISAADLKNVWEPFFTTKREGKGTGLGLAICKRIVEEHRGTMAIESELGQGTTVRIKLPVSSSWEE